MSEQAAKVSNPGIQQVRRFRSEKEFIGDGIFNVEAAAPEPFTIVDPLDSTRRKHLPPDTAFEDLLVPIFRAGKLVYQAPALVVVRALVQAQIGMFHAGVKRFVNPHEYPVGLELGLHELKMKLILHARGEA